MLSIETYKQSDICQPKDDDYDDENEQYTRIFENHEYTSEPDDEIDKIKPEDDTSEDHNEIFESKEHMNASIRQIFLGDLYVIGKIWIETLKTVLVGAQLRLVPVVHAARPPPPPPRPPKMKYKDLPIYTCPHYEYKVHEEKKAVNPAAKAKIMHGYLLPYVTKFRKEGQFQLCKMRCLTKSTFVSTKNALHTSGNDIKKMMRDPNNLMMRQGCVGTGTILGYLIGSRKLFFAGVGGLSTGALCFPEETNEFFKTLMAHTGNFALQLYNFYCTKNAMFRARVPCTDDVPAVPPRRREKPHCPKPKPKK